MARKNVSAVISGAGWLGSFAGLLIEGLRQSGCSDEEIHAFVTSRGKLPMEEIISVVARVIKAHPKVPVVVVYPAEGEEFELTIDGDDPANDPIAMVRGDGYSQAERWQYTGTRVFGKQTSHFRLVSVGYCHNLNEVRQKLAEHGEIPGGQWREAFKVFYPNPDGNGPIGIADPSWVYPYSFAFFPYVYTDGLSNFHWAAYDFLDDWRWLVRVSR